MAMTKATGNDIPRGTRAVIFTFKTDKGSCSVTFDRYATESTLFASLPQMTSNAIYSVLADSRKIETFTTYFTD